MTQQFQLSNVINVSVSETPAGVSGFNTSNLAFFSSETPSPAFDAGYKIYLEPTEVATDFGSSSVTYQMALSVFSQNPNILLPGGYLVIIPFEVSETLAAAITRTVNLVQYFGLMTTQIETQADMLAAAAVVQALNKIAFFAQYNPSSVTTGGSLDLLRSGNFTQSRGLFYDDSTSAGLNALLFQAAYASRGLSTVFSGSNTTQNMHLKVLAGVQPDPNITQTLLNNAETAGADCYISFPNFSCVFSSGENAFFDQVYNEQWLASAVQIAYFNYLAGTTTKVPQTEVGMDGIKGSIRAVMNQAVSNAYLAPGAWNSPVTFGNQTDLIANVAQFGYYIFSSPIAGQLQTDRANRIAPLIQIAAKESGAVNSGTVIINVNA